MPLRGVKNDECLLSSTMALLCGTGSSELVRWSSVLKLLKFWDTSIFGVFYMCGVNLGYDRNWFFECIWKVSVFSGGFDLFFWDVLIRNEVEEIRFLWWLFWFVQLFLCIWNFSIFKLKFNFRKNFNEARVIKILKKENIQERSW